MMNIHIKSIQQEIWMSKRGKGFSSTCILFIFIPHIYLLHCIKELFEAGFSVITVGICLPSKYNVSQQSTYACSASHLQGRSERRHQHTQSSKSQRISSFFFGYIILLCLTWSPLTVSLLLISLALDLSSNPFLHASDRLILSLLSCCSTWQRIMLGTLFAFQVIHYFCTFFFFFF